MSRLAFPYSGRKWRVLRPLASLFARCRGYSGSLTAMTGSLLTSARGMTEAATRRAEDRKTRKEEGKLTISAKPAEELGRHSSPGFIAAGSAPIDTQ